MRPKVSTAVVMMRSPNHRTTFLPELEWLVAPGIASGQFAFAQRSDANSGATAAIGLVLWAMVSEAVDKRLTGSNSRPKLKPEEWMSGQIPWLIEATGEPEATRELVKALVNRRFAKTGVRAMQLGTDGRLAMTLLKPEAETAPAAGTATN